IQCGHKPDQVRPLADLGAFDLFGADGRDRDRYVLKSFLCSTGDDQNVTQASLGLWRASRRWIYLVWVLGQSRSEEHTSELQSLMRISYAVFWLKKKTKN